jgi:hypothetical protein
LTISRREKGEGQPEKTAGNLLGGEGLIVDAIAMQCIQAATIPSMAWHASCLVIIDDSSHHVKIYPIGVNPSPARRRYHDLPVSYTSSQCVVMFNPSLPHDPLKNPRKQRLETSFARFLLALEKGACKHTNQLAICQVTSTRLNHYTKSKRNPCRPY